MFKIKDGYKLELQTPKTIKLFDSTKKLIGKTQNRESVTSVKVIQVFLAQFNLLDNQYQ